LFRYLTSVKWAVAPPFIEWLGLFSKNDEANMPMGVDFILSKIAYFGLCCIGIETIYL